MGLDQVQTTLEPRETDDNSQHSNVLWDFAAGLNSHLKAPVVGLKQIITGKILDNSQSQKAPIAESTARMAGEMVADAAIYSFTTAILRRTSLSALAPEAAGAVLGLIEPLKNGEGVRQRLVHSAMGAGTMAMIGHGPKFLAESGLIASAENSLAGTVLSGALIGGATEQANTYSRTGHLASPEQTFTGAMSFGLTSGVLHGLGNIAAWRATEFDQRSMQLDRGYLVSATAPERPPRSYFRQRQETIDANEGWHLLLGSGGSKAYLTGTGVVLAARAANLKIESFGGVSGGFYPAAMAASGMPSEKMLSIAKDTDIAKLVTLQPIFRHVREGGTHDLLKNGLYNTAPLGEMVRKQMPDDHWPDRLWTMAVSEKNSQIVFTNKGATEYVPQHQTIISSSPPTVSDAARATSAIPGILASMNLFGRQLYDGALGKFGKCPTEMAATHLGIPQHRIIASLPLGSMTTPEQKLYKFAKYLSGNTESNVNTAGSQAGIVIRPEVREFDSLRFSLSPTQRHDAIMVGYRAALEQFAQKELISGQRLAQARAAGKSISTLEDFFSPKPQFKFQPAPLRSLTLEAQMSSQAVF
jgi:hypothetical protein